MENNILKKAYVTGVVVGLTFPILTPYLGDRFNYFACTAFRFFKGASVGYLLYRTSNLVGEELFDDGSEELMDEFDEFDDFHQDLAEGCNNIAFAEASL